MKHLWLVCGARCTDYKDVCDSTCAVALVGNISRERAIRMLLPSMTWKEDKPIIKLEDEENEALL